MRALGLMSGTSLDGIDAAIIDTDGEDNVAPGPSLAVPYAPEERAVFAQRPRNGEALGTRSADAASSGRG